MSNPVLDRQYADLLADRPNITRAEAARRLGVSLSTIDRARARLKPIAAKAAAEAVGFDGAARANALDASVGRLTAIADLATARYRSGGDARDATAAIRATVEIDRVLRLDEAIDFGQSHDPHYRAVLEVLGNTCGCRPAAR